MQICTKSPEEHVIRDGNCLIAKLIKGWNFCRTQLHYGFSAKLKIWEVPACKMEPQSGVILWLGPSAPHPSTHPQLSFFCCAVSPPQQSMCAAVSRPPSKCFLSMLCGVPTPIIPLIKMVCAVSPPKKIM